MIDEANQKLEQGVQEFSNSERYKRYLEVMMKFHDYSIANTLMIFAQMPSAKRVAGYNTWKQVGRQVMKGEKSIKIFAPCFKKEKDELTGEEKKVLSYFRLTSVFDVSQTEGEELPSLCDELTGSVENFKTLIEALKKQTTATIEFGETGEAFGYYSRDGHKIVVKEGISEIHTIKTMIHEIAHSLLHKDENNETSIDMKELQAESVAFMVCYALGIDTSEYSFEYVGAWSGKHFKEAKPFLEEAKATAIKIIEGVQKEFEPLF